MVVAVKKESASAKYSPLSEWQESVQAYYQRHSLYDLSECFQWRELCKIELRIAAAPFGGPFAAIRDENKM